MPLIGLLSDSHGDALMTRVAVSTLVSQGATILLHLGDICSMNVIDALIVDPPLQSRLVFGNNDHYEIPSMTRYAQRLEIHVDHPVGRLDLGNAKTLVFLHGDDHHAMIQALEEKVTYLCHGHTHRATDRREGPTRILNPGALHRAREYTVALLDTDQDTVMFSSIRRSG